MDATNIGQNFTVLSINVLYRRCAIPVAWKVVEGTKKGSWKPHWQELFQSLQNIVPQDYLVIVSADRGLYADWLYQEIVTLGWHPFLRINHQGQYLVCDSSSWQPLTTVVTRETPDWSGQVTCFKSNPINCTLLARWDDNYADPWLILTDLNPTNAHVSWYGFRSWIEREGRWGFPSLSNHAVECSYRDVKSDGFGWQRTRLKQSDRAERHWLAMAVAMLWMVTLGLARKRSIIETVIDPSGSPGASGGKPPPREWNMLLNQQHFLSQRPHWTHQLKNISQIEHSRHRSPVNFGVNVLCGLIAYCYQPKKPSLNLEQDLVQYA